MLEVLRVGVVLARRLAEACEVLVKYGMIDMG